MHMTYWASVVREMVEGPPSFLDLFRGLTAFGLLGLFMFVVLYIFNYFLSRDEEGE